MRRTVIGVMGGTQVDQHAAEQAHELGRLIATNGWVLLNGGRSSGVMDASARGAQEAGGLTIGVLFDEDPTAASDYLDIVLPTGLGAGRNIINVLSSDVVVACQGSGGTLSEIALAVRYGRPLVLLDFDPGELFLRMAGSGPWIYANTAAEAVAHVREYLAVLGKQ